MSAWQSSDLSKVTLCQAHKMNKPKKKNKDMHGLAKLCLLHRTHEIHYNEEEFNIAMKEIDFLISLSSYIMF